jgi:hypothetical protein
MPERTVYHLLEEAADRYGAAPALHEAVVENGTRTWRPWNWIQYKQAVEEIAAGLHR